MQPTILIVDDEKHTRDGLRRLLEDEYDVYVAEDIGGALSVLERETVDLLLTDLRLAGEDGMQLIERALKMPHPPICVMMTAYGSVDTAVEAMKRGAYDFVTKPQAVIMTQMGGCGIFSARSINCIPSSPASRRSVSSKSTVSRSTTLRAPPISSAT